MIDFIDKDRRLAEWESTCTGMVVVGSRIVWRVHLLDEVNTMLTEHLIDSSEARALRERAEVAYTATTHS